MAEFAQHGVSQDVVWHGLPAPGTYFPEDATDFTCYVHPQARLGIAIAVLSVMLGILIILCSLVVTASLETRPPSV